MGIQLELTRPAFLPGATLDGSILVQSASSSIGQTLERVREQQVRIELLVLEQSRAVVRTVVVSSVRLPYLDDERVRFSIPVPAEVVAPFKTNDSNLRWQVRAVLDRAGPDSRASKTVEIIAPDASIDVAEIVPSELVERRLSRSQERVDYALRSRRNYARVGTVLGLGVLVSFVDSAFAIRENSLGQRLAVGCAVLVGALLIMLWQWRRALGRRPDAVITLPQPAARRGGQLTVLVDIRDRGPCAVVVVARVHRLHRSGNGEATAEFFRSSEVEGESVLLGAGQRSATLGVGQHSVLLDVPVSSPSTYSGQVLIVDYRVKVSPASGTPKLFGHLSSVSEPVLVVD